ncbi:MAG: dihydrofolate reductase family protein [Gemmatimonadales bacterium]
MPKLIANTFVTLDGVIQAPGGPDEDTSNGFSHGGWSVPFWDDTMLRTIADLCQRMEGLVLGRKTYEIFADHWPKVPDTDPIAAKLNQVPKYVASRTLGRVDWQNSTLLPDDLIGALARLREQPGSELQVHGSANLLQTLIRHDLVDEYSLWLFPIVIGTGKRLFGDGAVPAGLKLLETRTFDTGVAVLRYQRAGALRHGDFALHPAEEGVEASTTQAILDRERAALGRSA